jgi:hypothetical protein
MSNMDKSDIDSSGSAFEDYESLGVDHEHVLKAHAPPLNAGLSSAMPPRKKGVRSKQDVLGSTLLSGSATTTCKFVFTFLHK